MTLYHLNVIIHVLAAFIWLGGLFFLGVVGAPVLRHVEPPSVRAELFQRMGRRFRGVEWIAITVLLVTGVLNLHFQGLLAGGVLSRGAFWNTPYGRTLAVKLVTVVAMVMGSALHDFVLGPAAGRAEPGSEEALKLRRHAAWIGRVNALVGVILIVSAVLLTRGI